MNLNYQTREAQDAAAAREAEERREAAATFPLVREVVQQFAGKVYNCKFEKALQEALRDKAPGSIYARKDSYYVNVEYYPAARINGHFTLCSMKIKDLIDGKRIDGKALEESLKARRESLLQEAAAIEEQAANADVYRQQIEDLQRRLEHITGGICYTVRDIYSLDYRIRNY